MVTNKQIDAMQSIRKLAIENNLAVSIVTAEDALSAAGIDAPTEAQIQAVYDTYEWTHYGDYWSSDFSDMDIPR